MRPAATGPGLLAGQVVVVTAAAGAGIGAATARRCAEEGARVVLSDRHEARLTQAVVDLSGYGATGVACDVTDPRGMDDLLGEVEARLGAVDVLVNNAGLGGTATVSEMTDDEWHRVLDVSLGGTFRGTRAALRAMCPRRRGTIVNVASVTGRRAEAGQAHYGAAKAGVMALTRCAAVEGAPYGVRVNAVAPTLAMHPFLARVADPEVLAGWISHQPQQRAARPEEVADVIVWLASGASSYLTGEVISVGGQHP